MTVFFRGNPSGNPTQNLLDILKKAENTPPGSTYSRTCPKTPESKGLMGKFSNTRQQRKLVIVEDSEHNEDIDEVTVNESCQPTPSRPEKSGESPAKQLSPLEKTPNSKLMRIAEEETTGDDAIKIQMLAPSSESYMFPKIAGQGLTSSRSGLFDFSHFSFGGAGPGSVSSSASTDDQGGFGNLFAGSSKGAGNLGGFLF